MERFSKPARDKSYIYGKHALEEALRNAPRVIKKVFFAPEMDDRVLRESRAEPKYPDRGTQEQGSGDGSWERKRRTKA